MNWLDDHGRMQSGGLLCARDITENLANFEEVRSFMGNRIRINNIDVVSEPPWEYDFFTGGML